MGPCLPAFVMQSPRSVVRLVLILVITIMLGLLTTGISQAQSWYEGVGGYQRALAEHQRTAKPIFLYIYNPYCRYCIEYETQVLNKKPVEKYLSQFIKVRLLWDQPSGAVHKLAVGMGATGTPTVLVKHSKSKRFSRVSYRHIKNYRPAIKTPEEYIQSIEQLAPVY